MGTSGVLSPSSHDGTDCGLIFPCSPKGLPTPLPPPDPPSPPPLSEPRPRPAASFFPTSASMRSRMSIGLEASALLACKTKHLARLTNFVKSTKVKMAGRCEVDLPPGAGRQGWGRVCVEVGHMAGYVIISTPTQPSHTNKTCPAPLLPAATNIIMAFRLRGVVRLRPGSTIAAHCRLFSSQKLSPRNVSRGAPVAKRFRSAVRYFPHPGKDNELGEDANFISECGRVVGVADGVGGWTDMGVDAGEYSREVRVDGNRNAWWSGRQPFAPPPGPHLPLVTLSQSPIAETVFVSTHAHAPSFSPLHPPPSPAHTTTHGYSSWDTARISW